MKYRCRAFIIPLVSPILLAASSAWAVEPSVAPGPGPGSNAQMEGAQPVQPADPGASEKSNSAPAAQQRVEPASVVPANGSSPNSVAVSPYDSGNAESPTAAVSPATPQRSDVPATLLDAAADYAIGGFGGFGVSYTRLAGADRPMVCGEGAVIIDHALTLGGGGCGVVALMDAQNYGTAPHNRDDRMSFGYGGAIARYHFYSRRAINLAVGALIGAGGIEIGTWNGKDSRMDSSNYASKTQDPVFVVEPQIGGYANITRWLRFGAVGGFRFVSGVDIKGLRAKDLMGPTLGGQLQGGWF